MSTKPEQAVETFKERFNCSQSVLSVYSEEAGLDRETALKLACGFGAGMGRMGETCGAVTGAFMAIGLKFGASEPGDNPDKLRTFELIDQFARRFEARHGSLVCKELLGFDMSTPEGKETARQPGSFEICPKLVQSAVETLEEIIEAT
ncbi:MAG: C-GCAxxG-C-C family protein [Planctomycetota bacterium]|jgi:C_GCAxxG_C_C family probable redox protein